ncbi:iron-containing redox enzyme family protein [Gordonia sp. OPL2]|uniref:iron-containing redox enzyme family protein n=1 Tax=Gordonia sp. OPL2 TaxID=2486274 RepID=UPI001655FB44|nr:iron-containing redox enzyme family protein [Gordonia sp. OPL2]ROZ86556.1 iron-containing redox enzyme family protein [Gordonia sp. OPL2]
MTTIEGPPKRCPLLAGHGPVGRLVVELLTGHADDIDACVRGVQTTIDAAPRDRALLADLDVQRAWFVVAELDGRGVDGVDDRWNDHPAVSAIRQTLGDALEAAVRDRVGAVDGCSAAELPARVRRELAEIDAPAMSTHLQDSGTIENYRDLLRHRSLYHLREADPHTTAIPRLAGRAKAGLVEIQSDEYGGGREEDMHSTLFARSMRAIGLNSDYGAYAGDLPAVTLAWSNALTLFASRRRLRAAVVGHLLALECTSSLPNKRYAKGLRRLGYDADATRFFDEHVEADAVHEQIALYDMAVPLLDQEPELACDLLIGFRAALVLDADVGRHLLETWQDTSTHGHTEGPP